MGKLTKYSAAEIRDTVAKIATERDMTWELAAAMMLIDIARRAGMTELNQHLKGYSYAGTDFGDWKITITKVGG